MDLDNLMKAAKPEARILSWGLLWQSRFNHPSSCKVVYASLLGDFKGMVMMIPYLMQLPMMGWAYIGPEGTCRDQDRSDEMSRNHLAITSHVKRWSEDI